MLGNLRVKKQLLINPKEVVKLNNRYATLTSVEITSDIVREYKKQITAENINCKEAEEMFLYSALFNAGRVQGIREERRKHKK